MVPRSLNRYTAWSGFILRSTEPSGSAGTNIPSNSVLGRLVEGENPPTNRDFLSSTKTGPRSCSRASYSHGGNRPTRCAACAIGSGFFVEPTPRTVNRQATGPGARSPSPPIPRHHRHHQHHHQQQQHHSGDAREMMVFYRFSGGITSVLPPLLRPPPAAATVTKPTTPKHNLPSSGRPALGTILGKRT